MKKTIIFLCLVFTTLSLHARAIQEDYRRAEEKAQVSYALGMIIASNFNLESLNLEYDYNAIAEGIRAMLDNTIQPQFTENEAIEIIEAAINTAMERLIEENHYIEQTFLITNSQQPGIQITPSGLQYIIVKEAEGEKPDIDSVVRVNYTGTFTDGRLFDRSFDEGGVYIPLEMVIPGWSESLRLMSTGSIYRFYIPSHLAYGRDGVQGIIPPYTTLVFTIELLEIMNDDFDPYYQ